MKFQTSDIPKIAVTALATASIFMIDNFRSNSFQGVKTERISWETAQRFRNNYNRTNPMTIAVKNPDGSTTTKPLEGFTLDASAINEIMTNNKNGIGGKKSADELMILFGMEEVAGAMEFRIIAAGVQNDVLLKNADIRNVANSSVFDRADPCPPNRVTIN